jgi:5-methyltetrahydropteroyltriglutamate--homocysteine methyltransferase
MLRIHAGGYAIEAANPRHEHEWEVWKQVKHPEGKMLYSGFISQKTNVIEHPKLVAWRIKLYGSVVGRGNVVASTRLRTWFWRPEIAWVKLQALVEGARLATNEPWRH